MEDERNAKKKWKWRPEGRRFRGVRKRWDTGGEEIPETNELGTLEKLEGETGEEWCPPDWVIASYLGAPQNNKPFFSLHSFTFLHHWTFKSTFIPDVSRNRNRLYKDISIKHQVNKSLVAKARDRWEGWSLQGKRYSSCYEILSSEGQWPNLSSMLRVSFQFCD